MTLVFCLLAAASVKAQTGPGRSESGAWNHLASAAPITRADSGLVPSADAHLPDPSSVVRRSLMIPGWGQITNGQGWKVPLIYAAFSGAIVYTSQLTVRYHDYRAAVYNLSRGEQSDQRFGPTPSYIPLNANASQLQTLRDRYRNRRDFMFVAIGLIHGLNALDAYVFAHMNAFDVSDDLSHRIHLSPGIEHHPAGPAPSLSMKIQLGASRR